VIEKFVRAVWLGNTMTLVHELVDQEIQRSSCARVIHNITSYIYTTEVYSIIKRGVWRERKASIRKGFQRSQKSSIVVSKSLY
jgi:23S rRNA maturation mini-RNase III